MDSQRKAKNCFGGQWRIPEITDTPSRGFTGVRYYNFRQYEVGSLILKKT